jgi:hypothetical protein
VNPHPALSGTLNTELRWSRHASKRREIGEEYCARKMTKEKQENEEDRQLVGRTTEK